MRLPRLLGPEGGARGLPTQRAQRLNRPPPDLPVRVREQRRAEPLRFLGLLPAEAARIGLDGGGEQGGRALAGGEEPMEELLRPRPADRAQRAQGFLPGAEDERGVGRGLGQADVDVVAQAPPVRRGHGHLLVAAQHRAHPLAARGSRGRDPRRLDGNREAQRDETRPLHARLHAFHRTTGERSIT